MKPEHNGGTFTRSADEVEDGQVQQQRGNDKVDKGTLRSDAELVDRIDLDAQAH